ncbi:Exocyst complex subunit Exo70, C-terminal [Dillenia turbinata]|uniref:Exocyst subunit Exo70 family protein n=1 Tax=Dillenia turbinata TaxID=194707 RepID=A0AAN8VYC1_9MAGN
MVWSIRSEFEGYFKEGFKSFNTAFEEVYKIQTEWLVSNHELRERLLTSQRVILAYWAFIGRSSNHVGDKVVYTVDELENFVLDLFEGTSKSLQNFRKGGWWTHTYHADRMESADRTPRVLAWSTKLTCLPVDGGPTRVMLTGWNKLMGLHVFADMVDDDGAEKTEWTPHRMMTWQHADGLHAFADLVQGADFLSTWMMTERKGYWITRHLMTWLCAYDWTARCACDATCSGDGRNQLIRLHVFADLVQGLPGGWWTPTCSADWTEPVDCMPRVILTGRHLADCPHVAADREKPANMTGRGNRLMPEAASWRKRGS